MLEQIKAALAKLPPHGQLVRFCGEVLQQGGPSVANCGDTFEGGHLWAEVFANSPQWLAALVERVEEQDRLIDRVYGLATNGLGQYGGFLFQAIRNEIDKAQSGEGVGPE